MTTKFGSQQKQSPEEGILEGGPIPLNRDTTRIGHCLEKRTFSEGACTLDTPMNEERLSHLPFWGPSEGFFLID